MAEEVEMQYLSSLLLERLQPFLRHVLYNLEKAAHDTPLSLTEAANLLGIKRSTLKKRCQRGTFPYKKIGDTYYISLLDVNLYIKGGIKELEKYNKDIAQNNVKQ